MPSSCTALAQLLGDQPLHAYSFRLPAARNRRALPALLVVLGFLVLRLPSLVHGLDINDEGLWAVVTDVWMNGGKLYIDVVERRPPLLYGLYALVFAIGGRFNMIAIHIAAALWTLLTMWGVSVIARRIFDARVGLAAAILYGLYSAWGDYTNLAWNGEILLNLPVVWAIVVTFHQSRSRVRPELVGAGALLACGFLIKQPAAASAAALGVYLLLPGYRRTRGLGGWYSILHAAELCVGFAIVLGGALGYLRSQGSLREALYWVIQHHDLPHGPTDIIFWERLAVGGMWFSLACFPLLAAAAATLLSERRKGIWVGREAERTALYLLLATAMIGVCASGRFYLHYFLLLLPGLALTAAPTVAAILAGEGPEGPWPLRRRALGVLLGASAVAFLTLHAIQLGRRRGSESARFIREHSNQADRIFVWGEKPRIYVESRRRPSSRYIGTYPLTGFPYGGSISYDPTYLDTSNRIVPGAWSIFERELSERPPRFIVDAETKLRIPRYPIAGFPILARLVEGSYRKVHDAGDGVIYERTAPTAPTAKAR